MCSYKIQHAYKTIAAAKSLIVCYTLLTHQANGVSYVITYLYPLYSGKVWQEFINQLKGLQILANLDGFSLVNQEQ